jgi:hypothetical protein
MEYFARVAEENTQRIYAGEVQRLALCESQMID